MAKSVSYSNTVLDSLFGSGTPATLYIALYTSAPSADGTGGTEVTGGSYARAAVTNNSTNWPAAALGSKANGTAINFATASAGWGSAVAAGVMAASSGGTPYYFGNLTTARTINNGDTFSFAIGQLVITEF
jgi:hypothetical protein